MEATYTADELRNFFAWQLEQYNPMFGKKNKDCWNGATVDSLMASPVAVVIRACEMPEESCSVMLDPAVATTAKILIIPITVPSNPSSGAPATIVANAGNPR